jgi:hypothetical protein
VISRAVNFTVSQRRFTARLVTSQPGQCRGPPAIAGCLIHAGEYRQQPGQIGEGKKAEHQLLGGGQQQLPAGLTSILATCRPPASAARRGLDQTARW